MVKVLTSVAEYMDFANEINRDPDFSDPMLISEEQMRNHLLNAPTRQDCQVLGVFDGETMTGLFVFLVLEDESYLEMLVGLSRSLTACEEMLAWLKEHYQGWQADFVYNPGNRLLHGVLEQERAEFEPEVQKMVLKRDVPYESSHQIELYSEKYREGYRVIHDDDDGRYWTADKVIAAPERFRIILAVEQGEVVGYIDITHKYEENEPYDVFVKESHRRKGYARAMLARAIELNRPKELMVLVEANNAAEIALYESMGFDEVEGEGNITAHVLL